MEVPLACLGSMAIVIQPNGLGNTRPKFYKFFLTCCFPTLQISLTTLALFFYLAVRLLLRHGADPTKKNRDGHTPVDLVKEGDQDVLDLLRGDSALLDAAKKGNLGRVQKLLTPENVNCRDSQVRTEDLSFS